jgi:hypothetical protein
MREGRMPYLIPPMDPEPPADYVAFVAGRLATLPGEAARLIGPAGDPDEIYLQALADVAGRWRRLRLLSWWRRRDAVGEFLSRRLAALAKQWRDEQIYPVDVHVLRPPPLLRFVTAGSVALRKAPLLPDTARPSLRPTAEAAIAWAHAYRRHRLRRLARGLSLAVLLFLTILQLLPTPDGS